MGVLDIGEEFANCTKMKKSGLGKNLGGYMKMNMGQDDGQVAGWPGVDGGVMTYRGSDGGAVLLG